MPQLKIHLRQHTPLLHFQSEQAGATLRASEVKPRLDRFILSEIGKDKVRMKEWVTPACDTALDYKLRIVPIGTSKLWNNIKLRDKSASNKTLLTEFPYFGNVGDTEYPKELVYYPLGVDLFFFSLKEALLEHITKKISKFLAHTNFGTRQSKGFGSFYVDSKEKKCYQDLKNSFLGKSTVLLSYFESDGREIFADINRFYKSIRSGLYPFKRGIEVASALNYYLLNRIEPVQWDKTTIRKVIDNRCKDANGNLLYRDMLGLASSCRYGGTGTISKTMTGIERYKSPVFIKPVWARKEQFEDEGKLKSKNVYRVYVGYIEPTADNSISNQTIQLKGRKIRVKPTSETRGKIRECFDFDIKTPSPEEFSLGEYMDFLFTDFKLSDCQKNEKPDWRWKRLETIYSELQRNYKPLKKP